MRSDGWKTETIAKYYIGATSSGQVQGSKRKCGQSYADVSELPLSPHERERIEAMLRKFGRHNSLLDQWSTTNKMQRRNEVWARPRAGAGGLIRIQYFL